MHGRAEMEKFLAEHGDLQMAVNNNETEKSLTIIDEAIKTGNWTDEALQELDNLIKEYYNGRNEITQILGRSLSETSRRSEAYAAASIIARRVQGSVRQSDGTLSVLREFTTRTRERRLIERALQQWAQENGWWWNDYASESTLDNYLVSEYGEKKAEGSESFVYQSKDGNYVIKAMSAIASDGDIGELLQKIELYNQIFPDTSLEILGFGKTKDGNFRVILQQPLIKGETISAREAEEALKDQLGVKKGPVEHSQTLFDGKVILRDITNPENRGNILKSANGNYYVIDADIAFSEEIKAELNKDTIDDAIQLFTTPEGEVYGFVDKQGRIYLDEAVISPEHPIYEYTHLWGRGQSLSADAAPRPKALRTRCVVAAWRCAVSS